jgi:hypothetical protein
MGLISRIKELHHCDPATFGGRSNPLIIIPFLVLLSPLAIATIITVKQDGSGNFTTIQAGINAAATSDTVLVWPGIYLENVDYNSKNITVASLYLTTQNDNYIHTTIIDGNNNGSCVTIINCNEINSTLCGFTIQHGSGYSLLKQGGGLYIEASYFNIINCIIKNNISRSGGGIYAKESELFLKGSLIKSNRALYQTGGILINYGTVIYLDTIFLNSIYLNDGPMGCDFAKSASCPEIKLVLDTGTVQNPDKYFYNSYNSLGYPVGDITWQISNAKVTQINSDLYVNPNGNNANSGLSPIEPLQTIAFAFKRIVPDSINPKTIYLSDGIYSPGTNNEIFPVIQRGYVSIKGSDMNNTIIDAEYLYPLYYSYINKNFTIENIQFKRGLDNQTPYGGYGGLVLGENDSVTINNIIINESKGGYYSALFTVRSVFTISNSLIQNNIGGYPVAIFNTNAIPRKAQIFNSKVSHNGPGQTFYEYGHGGGIGFGGSYSYPNATNGSLINVLIEENIYSGEPASTNFGICGLSCSENAIVNVINSTLANNIVTNTIPSGQVYATEGAEINFYNSIVYGAEDYEIFLGDGTPTSDIATVNITNTDVKGGEANIQNWNNIHELNWLDGNIDENPLWTSLGDDPYSLQPGSPCIDSGLPMYEEGMDYPYIKEENNKYILYMLDGDTVTLPATDLAGNPRISGGRIDMGAYEWQDTITSVDLLPQSSVSELSVSPNPFTSNLFISFKTTHQQFITIKVLNLQGQLINTITENNYPAGSYRLVWDGHDDSGFPLHSGTCLICLYSGGTLQSVIKANKINPR